MSDKLTSHIVSFGSKPENLIRAIEQKTIGSTFSTFKSHLRKGATIFLHCKSVLWGIGMVDSDYFYEEEEIWRDKTYPHRFSIKLCHLAKEPVTMCDGWYNVRLRESFGTGWAYKFIFAPKPLPGDIAADLHRDLAMQSAFSAREFVEHLAFKYKS